MVKIIPAILETSLGSIRDRLGDIAGAASTVQLDVVDGVLAPTHTWPHTPHGKEEFQAILSGEAGLPHWEDFDFEVDLMVKEATREAREWVAAGASRLVVHAASPDARTALQTLQESRRNETFSTLLGLALESSDTVEALSSFDGLYDYIQVMGIAHVGVQGAAFDERALTLVAALRTLYPKLSIQVDGGVHLENVKKIAEAGANALIVGSAIFAEGEPRVNMEELSRVVNS